MVPFYLCCEFDQNPWQKNFLQIFKFFEPFLVQFLYTSKFIFWPYFWINQAETWNILIHGPFLSMLWFSSKFSDKKFWPNFRFSSHFCCNFWKLQKNFGQIFRFFKPFLVQLCFKIIKICDKKILAKFSSFSSHFWCKFCKLQNSFLPYFWINQAKTWNILIDGPFLYMLWIS